MSSLLDRRRPPRSDQRRTELLSALDALLRDGTLEEITVADIAEQVGMTRSAFYFYFENKGAAVAALSAQMYDDAASSAHDLFSLEGAPRARIEAQMRGLVATWQSNQHLYRAMLHARETSPEIRAMWDIGRESFIDPVVAMIDAERAAGNAPGGPDSTALATLLLELNDRAIESIARGHELPLEDRVAALVTIWLRTIYGTDTPLMRDTLTFTSAGVACEAWHYPGHDDRLASAAGRPCVVMAHGFGGTKDTGLEGFAEELAAAGCDVLAFDYRGFGASAGQPRQQVSLAGQVADYRAALAAVKRLPGVDPDRLVLWGVSLSGGTVLEVAAGRIDLAALVALTPLVSGPAAAVAGRAHYPAAASLASTGRGVAAKVRGPRMLPIVADPGEPAVLPLPGMKADYLAIAGPTWRNEVDAGIVLDVLRHRPARYAAQVPCPALFQIADFDRCAPPQAAADAAFKAGAHVHHYPADHFDIYPGKPLFAQVAADQVRFLSQVLAPAPAVAGVHA